MNNLGKTESALFDKSSGLLSTGTDLLPFLFEHLNTTPLPTSLTINAPKLENGSAPRIGFTLVGNGVMSHVSLSHLNSQRTGTLKSIPHFCENSHQFDVCCIIHICRETSKFMLKLSSNMNGSACARSTRNVGVNPGTHIVPSDTLHTQSKPWMTIKHTIWEIVFLFGIYVAWWHPSLELHHWTNPPPDPSHSQITTHEEDVQLENDPTERPYIRPLRTDVLWKEHRAIHTTTKPHQEVRKFEQWNITKKTPATTIKTTRHEESDQNVAARARHHPKITQMQSCGKIIANTSARQRSSSQTCSAKQSTCVTNNQAAPDKSAIHCKGECDSTQDVATREVTTQQTIHRIILLTDWRCVGSPKDRATKM